MCKITPIEIISSMSGKVCTHGNMYFAVNKQTGKIHTAKMCNVNHNDPSDAQLEQQQKFSTRSKDVSAWFASNRPSEENPNGTAQYRQGVAAFRAQHKIGTFFAYVSTRMNDDGTVTFPNIRSTGGANSGLSGDL